MLTCRRHPAEKCLEMGFDSKASCSKLKVVAAHQPVCAAHHPYIFLKHRAYLV